jgi:hypothetical protein
MNLFQQVSMGSITKIKAVEQPTAQEENAAILLEKLLNHVDILTAISYYGITELLDTIGEDELRAYLNSK